MSRMLSDVMLPELEKSNSVVPLVYLLTVTHPELADVPRLASNEYGDKIADHVYGGDRFYGIPFRFSLLTDTDRPARARCGMLNINRQVGQFVLGLRTACRLKLEMFRASDFTSTLDPTQKALLPIGTPVVLFRADYCFLRNVGGDADWVEGDLSRFSQTGVPFPYIRITDDVAPGANY